MYFIFFCKGSASDPRDTLNPSNRFDALIKYPTRANNFLPHMIRPRTPTRSASDHSGAKAGNNAFAGWADTRDPAEWAAQGKGTRKICIFLSFENIYISLCAHILDCNYREKILFIRSFFFQCLFCNHSFLKTKSKTVIILNFIFKKLFSILIVVAFFSNTQVQRTKSVI